MNDADQWTDVSSGLLPPGGSVWAVATGGLPPEDFCLFRNGCLEWVYRVPPAIRFCVEVALGRKGRKLPHAKHCDTKLGQHALRLVGLRRRASASKLHQVTVTCYGDSRHASPVRKDPL